MWLSELGTYHYKARAYSPQLGRFLQTDPIGYQGGMNLYAYVGNDPVNLADPMGLRVVITCDAACRERLAKQEAWLTGFVNDRIAAVTGPYFDEGPVEGGGSDSGDSDEDGQNDEEDKACQILRNVSESTKGALPGYVTGNKNWNNASTLRGYMNYYQSNVNQWQAVNGRLVG